MPLGNAPLTIVGTIGQDPELRQAGAAQVASFSVAVSARVKNGDAWEDGPTTWFRCNAWRELGEHVVASLHKGDRVILQGTIGARKYEKDGVERESWEVDVEAIGAELRFATSTVQRAQAGGAPRQQGRQASRAGQAPAGGQQNAWAAPGAYDDETPF